MECIQLQYLILLISFITPSGRDGASVLERISRQLPRIGSLVLQFVDEIQPCIYCYMSNLAESVMYRKANQSSDVAVLL
jgi:hypothetical protein